jgi:ATP-dependent helicase/nuclease subunit B
MPINRVFLNWNRPALVATAEYLAQQYSAAGTLDLGNVVVALPGGRAGRRLLEILVEQTDQRELILIPPRIVTAGQLPELLYVAKKPFASDLAQQMSWVGALKGSTPEHLRRLMPAPPADDDLPAWLALAKMIGNLHRELAADALDFAAVVEGGARLDGFQEKHRWQALAAVQQDYLRTLDQLDLWDLQTARLYAIRQNEYRAAQRIVLVGTADLNRTQRMILDQVADQVTTLVVAPAAMVCRTGAAARTGYNELVPQL